MSPPNFLLAALLLPTPNSNPRKTFTRRHNGPVLRLRRSNSDQHRPHRNRWLAWSQSWHLYHRLPPGRATKIDVGSAAAIECESQAAKTYAACLSLPTTKDLSGQPLVEHTLFPGVYNFATTASIDGLLKLGAGLNSGGQFIFKIGTSLTTASVSQIVLAGLAKGCNVFFCVGSSATIGPDIALQ